MRDLKIDIVYLWVDGNDKKWKYKKYELEKKINGSVNINPDANLLCRFIDNQELKYSLRSLEKHAPWINHVYIVTDDQCPNWLNLHCQKVTLIDHKDIMPKEALPSFNSIAIENCICNIKGLSEYFLYANDDMFFYKKITPDFFYDKNLYPICRFHRTKKHPENSLYNAIIENARLMIKDKFNIYMAVNPHHCIDAYRKSDFLAFQKEYKEEVKKVIYSNFRKRNNFERIAYLMYACVIQHGRKKIVKKVDLDLPTIIRMKNYIIKKYSKDSLYISANSENPKIYLEKFSPKLFCINDNEHTSNDDRTKIKEILEEIFPEKSSFEI